MAIEIVDLPIKNGGSFHGYVNVYRRVSNQPFYGHYVCAYIMGYMMRSFTRQKLPQKQFAPWGRKQARRDGRVGGFPCGIPEGWLVYFTFQTCSSWKLWFFQWPRWLVIFFKWLIGTGNLLLWRCLVAMEVMSYLQKRYRNKRNQSSCVEKISSYNSYDKKQYYNLVVLITHISKRCVINISAMEMMCFLRSSTSSRLRPQVWWCGPWSVSIQLGWSSWTWLVFPGHFGHGLTLETSRLV